MKLVDFFEDIEDFDQESIIFQEVMDDPFSDIIISYPEEGDQGIKEINGKKYYYLIEVFLATEFIEDWLSSLDKTPTTDEITKRLHQYARNDT